MPFFRMVSTGDTYYSPNELYPPTFVSISEAEAGPNVRAIPQSITNRQFRLGLLAIGQFGNIDRAVKKEDSYEGKQMQIEWAFAETFQRDSDIVIALCTLVSMGDAEIDETFINGAAS
jgi:hypothetical protein